MNFEKPHKFLKIISEFYNFITQNGLGILNVSCQFSFPINFLKRKIDSLVSCQPLTFDSYLTYNLSRQSNFNFIGFVHLHSFPLVPTLSRDKKIDSFQTSLFQKNQELIQISYAIN